MASRRFLFTLYAILFIFGKNTLALRNPDNLFLGDLRTLYHATATDFDVLFQGQRITCKEGLFFCSLPRSFPQMLLLFIDPANIHVSNKDNTIWYLTTTTETPYQAFECRIIRKDNTNYSWDIRRVALPGSFKDGESNVLVIPINTLIIPFAPQHFRADTAQTIKLDSASWNNDARAIPLPTPLAPVSDSATLKKAIIHANMALLNLRAVHGAQQKAEFIQDHLHVTMLEPL